jgi:hypothetical protein
MAGCAWGLIGAEKAKRSLSVFHAHAIAKEVPVPKTAHDLHWMADLWICADRALRQPPSNNDSFPHLQTFDLRDRDGSSAIVHPSQYGDGCLLEPMCSLVTDGAGRKPRGTNLYVFNFYIKAKGVSLGPPGQADFLYLKRDPNDPPRWFILEHQDSGDVLLFERASTNAISDTKH